MRPTLDMRKPARPAASALAVLAAALPLLWPASSGAWSYKEAAQPYAGQSITVLDEVTPLQEAMQKLVPQFEQETGIDVDYQLLNHFEVISRGQADLLSGRGEYDAIMVHSPQMGLLLELPAVYPDHLEDVPELARRHPGLTIVVDHLGKPPLGTARMGAWEELLRAVADRPNVYAKISGLNTVAPSPWSAADLEPAVRVALEAFGAERLVCGSDWPVALLNGSYEQVWRETTLAIERVAGASAEQILTSTATTLYRLAPERRGAR